MPTYQVVLISLIAALAVVLIILLALAGGDLGRLGIAYRTFVRVLQDHGFRDKLKALADAQQESDKSPRPSAVPLRLLALLQRDGRLLDFLLEDIQAYPDGQIGAAVRDIHKNCRHALQEHLVLEPVIAQPEGATVEVPPGFDPSAIRLTGNVTGQPPFRGTLQHHGWKVKEIKLSPPPPGQDELVLMAAEVELP
jgi:hypothetical protein